jgi:3-phosphoshikimate 1-carboxyvinyltransferase
MLAALAAGESVIRGALTSLDARSTAGVLRRLGVAVSPLRQGAMITISGRRQWRQPVAALDCGNSGTTARLMLGLLAGQPVEARLSGDRSLRGRPMARVTDPLTAMGAGFPDGGSRLPLWVVGGRLRALEWTLPVASAQIKSALLLAGVTGGVAVRLREPGASRDHTERMLGRFGYRLNRVGGILSFEPSGEIRPFDLTIPGDPSSAAFLLAAGAMGQGGEVAVDGVGLNPGRTGFLAVLDRMGARVRVDEAADAGGEPVGRLAVGPCALHATTISPDEVPSLIDEVPVLAILAARAEGESRFRGLAELRVKESDRLTLLAENLRTIGVEAEVVGEDLVVVGTDRRLAGRVRTAGDHRMAMAFALLGGGVEVDHPEAADVSFPGFHAMLAHLRGRRGAA